MKKSERQRKSGNYCKINMKMADRRIFSAAEACIQATEEKLVANDIGELWNEISKKPSDGSYVTAMALMKPSENNSKIW